jgi:uncharacterized membrane protein YkoI
MNTIRTAIAASLLTVCALAAHMSLAADGPLSKERATEMALQAHPGEAIKAYQETKKGKKVWEIQVKGADGKHWEVFYDVETGKFIEDKG